jgi:hypothetical protein|tara:strand:- start:252 stop:419 length:168 start_codon:yes stop_codon:yes gene_type:complete
MNNCNNYNLCKLKNPCVILCHLDLSATKDNVIKVLIGILLKQKRDNTIKDVTPYL